MVNESMERTRGAAVQLANRRDKSLGLGDSQRAVTTTPAMRGIPILAFFTWYFELAQNILLVERKPELVILRTGSS
jgi:hypothetical protein